MLPACRVYYIFPIKLSPASFLHCVHGAVKRLHRAILSTIKRKPVFSASTAARSHRNLPADALLDVKDVSSRYLGSHKTQNFFSLFFF